MAFIVGTDDWNSQILGDEGSVAIGAERSIYYAPYATLTQYDPTGLASTFVKIDNVEEFTSTEDTNLIEVWNGRSLEEKKQGRTNSTLTIKQMLKSTLNSIHVLKNQDLYFAECLSDDRAPVSANGNPIYYEVRLMRGKLSAMTEDKGDAESLYSVSGEGSFEVDSRKVITKGITPVSPTISGATGLVSGSTSSLTITANHLYGDAITLTDITADTLMDEITSITVEAQTTSTVTFTQSAGTASNIVKITASSTTPGSIVLKGKIATGNSGSWYTAEKTITYTTV